MSWGDGNLHGQIPHFKFQLKYFIKSCSQSCLGCLCSKVCKSQQLTLVLRPLKKSIDVCYKWNGKPLSCLTTSIWLNMMWELNMIFQIARLSLRLSKSLRSATLLLSLCSSLSPFFLMLLNTYHPICFVAMISWCYHDENLCFNEKLCSSEITSSIIKLPYKLLVTDLTQSENWMILK